jgi:hypothetical protein
MYVNINTHGCIRLHVCRSVCACGSKITEAVTFASLRIRRLERSKECGILFLGARYAHIALCRRIQEVPM